MWFLWRSPVRDVPSGPDHFASTCLLSIDNLEYLHMFNVFLLFGYGLVDKSYQGCFLSWHRQPPSRRLPRQSCLPPPFRCPGCSAVQFPSWLCRWRRLLSTLEMTDIDGPETLSRMIVSLHFVLSWMFFVIGSSAVLPTNAHVSQPLRPLCSA